MDSYWNETGKYQEAYTEFWSKLVPDIGPSSFVEGENLRAATKLYWDYCNNGFGNNVTGAYNWLVKQGMLSKNEQFFLKPYVNCQAVDTDKNSYTVNDPIAVALESIMDRVNENLLARKIPEDLTPHLDDMFAYSEPERNDDSRWY